MASKPMKKAATKPRRNKKERGRLPLTYIENLNIRCKQLNSKTKQACNRPVEYHEPGIGDVCSDHRRTARAIRYARKPQGVAA